jgi:hypothetical protein
MKKIQIRHTVLSYTKHDALSANGLHSTDGVFTARLELNFYILVIRNLCYEV